MADALFSPLRIGAFEAKNRIFMAPMTRGRAHTSGGVPKDIVAEYYRQRAEGGLLITEGTFVSKEAIGWVNAPGIFEDAHVQGWKKVTSAVHEAGGRIFLQLWHMGRVSHPDFGNGQPVGPSPIAAKGKTTTPEGSKEYVEPRELTADDLQRITDDFVRGAQNAIAAGFDGVEIHGANGYLIDQFVRDGSNQRTDAFGGSIENRWRFPLQVVRAVAAAVGADKTAIRLSPVVAYNDMNDSDPVASFTYGAKELGAMGLAYVHVLEARGGMMANPNAPKVHPHMRSALGQTPMVLNGGYDAASAEAAIQAGECDAVTFGVPFLVNPDLVARIRAGRTESNKPDFSTFYTPEAIGYTDYPMLEG